MSTNIFEVLLKRIKNATALGLSEPETYTGHCFKRFLSLLADLVTDRHFLKRYRNWKLQSKIRN